MGALYFDYYLSYSMPKLCCAVNCLKFAELFVAVNTSVGFEFRGPLAAPLDSAWKKGLETTLWVCYMIIYRHGKICAM
jgi:hypothetical protein